LHQIEDGWRLGPAFDIEPHRTCRANEVEHAVAGDVGERMHRQPRIQDVQHRPHVDLRRPEQLVRQGAAELGDVAVQRETTALQEGSARQREPVRVQTAALETEEHVAGLHRIAGDYPVERDCADRSTNQIEGAARTDAADHLAHLGQLTARTADAGQLAAARDPLSEGAEQLGIGLFDGDVVDQCNRTSTDAQHVVDVHGDAVDADAVVASGCLRNQELGADAVGRDRNPQVRRHRNHVGEVANVEGGAGSTWVVEGGANPPQQRAEPATGRADAHAVLGEGRHRLHRCSGWQRPVRMALPERERAGVLQDGRKS
jgi:hypothetical protein